MKSILIITACTVFIFSSCKKATPDAPAVAAAATAPIIIAPPPPGQFSAKFTFTEADPNNILEKQIISFKSLGCNIVSYVWQLGNGTKVFNANPKVSYDLHGIYNVTLTVKDAEGNIASCTKQITVLCNFLGH